MSMLLKNGTIIDNKNSIFEELDILNYLKKHRFKYIKVKKCCR